MNTLKVGNFVRIECHNGAFHYGEVVGFYNWGNDVSKNGKGTGVKLSNLFNAIDGCLSIYSGDSWLPDSHIKNIVAFDSADAMRVDLECISGVNWA